MKGFYRRRLERRLIEEAGAARREPSGELRRRTLAALRDVTPATPRPTLPRRAAYAWAFALVAMLSAAAVLLVRAPVRPADEVERPVIRLARLLGASAMNDQLVRLESNCEEPLLAEARLLVDDAIAAGEYLLVRLPLPVGQIRRGPTE